MENEKVIEEQSQQQQQQQQTEKAPSSLLEVNIKDEITALNVLISFLQLANKRGTFNLEEAAKIWECVKKFQKK